MGVATVCPRSSDPFYIITYYMKWVTTSWTDMLDIYRYIFQESWIWVFRLNPDPGRFHVHLPITLNAIQMYSIKLDFTEFWPAAARSHSGRSHCWCRRPRGSQCCRGS